MELNLNPVEIRVLGVLVEKQLATPDYYPMTLNALVNACNQKTNREPVMDLDEPTVSAAVDALRNRRLVWQVKVQGSRSLKYEHNLKDTADFSTSEIGLLCELMLRGPQTAGELRSRASRLTAFHGLPAVEHTLHTLMTRDNGPFVVKLPRRPGHKEHRYTHLLGDVAEDPVDVESVLVARESGDDDRIALLESKLAALQTQVDELGKCFLEFKRQFE